MQTAKRPQHAPDHLQSYTVKLGKLVEEQSIDCPERRRDGKRGEVYTQVEVSCHQNLVTTGYNNFKTTAKD